MSLQYPDLNCARVARPFLVRSFSESMIGCRRSSNTILFFRSLPGFGIGMINEDVHIAGI